MNFLTLVSAKIKSHHSKSSDSINIENDLINDENIDINSFNSKQSESIDSIIKNIIKSHTSLRKDRPLSITKENVLKKSFSKKSYSSSKTMTNNGDSGNNINYIKFLNQSNESNENKKVQINNQKSNDDCVDSNGNTNHQIFKESINSKKNSNGNEEWKIKQKVKFNEYQQQYDKLYNKPYSQNIDLISKVNDFFIPSASRLISSSKIIGNISSIGSINKNLLNELLDKNSSLQKENLQLKEENSILSMNFKKIYDDNKNLILGINSLKDEILRKDIKILEKDSQIKELNEYIVNIKTSLSLNYNHQTQNSLNINTKKGHIIKNSSSSNFISISNIKGCSEIFNSPIQSQSDRNNNVNDQLNRISNVDIKVEKTSDDKENNINIKNKNLTINKNNCNIESNNKQSSITIHNEKNNKLLTLSSNNYISYKDKSLNNDNKLLKRRKFNQNCNSEDYNIDTKKNFFNCSSSKMLFSSTNNNTNNSVSKAIVSSSINKNNVKMNFKLISSSQRKIVTIGKTINNKNKI